MNRPGRCKHCKVRFTEEERGKRLHPECIDPWMEAFREKQKRKAQADRRAKQKVERAQDKQRKAALKTIPDLIKEAQVAFNAAIRARDRDQPCISCGASLQAEALGGGYDCGHYRSTGSASHLRFNEDNAHGQCKRCNRWGAGMAVDYRLRLVERIGLGRVESLEGANDVVKWTREELIAIRDKYRAKTKELLKEKT